MSQDKQGTDFRYTEVPGTTPIVLVHGVGLDQRIWDAMLGDFGGRSTLTYDLLGHGDTAPPLGAQSFQPFVAQLHSLLQELQVTKIILAGFSLGGQVAKRFAASHPQMANALVLISTTYQRTAEERAAMSSRLQQAKEGDQQGLEVSALQRWFNPEFLAANPAVESQITARLQNNDPARFLESYELLSNAEDHSVDYGALAMPALVLTGDGDPGSTPRMATEMAAAMANARVEVVQGAKHLGIIELHQDFSDAIAGFLAEHGL
jgi:pimeloyl-ACP methyl ester carboxylesterase